MSAGRARLLVLGAGGQIGGEVMARAAAAGLTAEAPERPYDIADANATETIIAAARPAAVINAAAFTAVDRAEQEPERAFAVNAQGVAHVAAACARHGAALLHLSTDYVFGDGAAPRHEDDPIAPLNVYGASKAAGELAVRAILARHLIVRTSGVFGPRGRNFVGAILAAAAQGRPLRVVEDEVTCPTPAGQVAEVVLHMARRLAENGEAPWGTYHYCAEGPVSWFAFARAALDDYTRLTGRQPSLTAVTSAAYGAAARRPSQAVLDCTRIGRVWNIAQRSWRDDLAATVAAIAGEQEGR